jgi:hypothetical protein
MEAAELPGKDRGLGKADRAQRVAHRKLLEVGVRSGAGAGPLRLAPKYCVLSG